MRSRLIAIAVLGVVAALAVSCSGGDTPNSSRSSSGSSSPVTGASNGRAIPTVIALDVSGSMNTDDLGGTRIQAARSAVRDLAASFDDRTEVGLVRFGGARADADPAACTDVADVVPVGPLDRAGLDAKLAALVPTGRTPTGLALQLSARQLPATTPAAIIIVSDGEANCAPYPCDVARALHDTHPNLTVSAIALHSPAGSFRCLTAPSAGLAVAADSARQLVQRLGVLGDVDGARQMLAPTGAQGLAIGESYMQIRSRFGDFPQATISTTAGDATVVEWRNCKWVFDSQGVLTQIRVDAGSTIDGVRTGDNISRAREEYGTALSSVPTQGAEADLGDQVTTFAADTSAGTNWRVISSGGTIRRLALCRCGDGATARSVPGFPDIAALQALPEAGTNGLYGRWWVRGSTLVIDRDSRRVFIWSTEDQDRPATEVIARIDRIDGAGGAATVVESSTDAGPYAVGTSFAFSAHLLRVGDVLSVHFARRPTRDWCGQTVLASCFE